MLDKTRAVEYLKREIVAIVLDKERAVEYLKR